MYSAANRPIPWRWTGVGHPQYLPLIPLGSFFPAIVCQLFTVKTMLLLLPSSSRNLHLFLSCAELSEMIRRQAISTVRGSTHLHRYICTIARTAAQQLTAPVRVAAVGRKKQSTTEHPTLYMYEYIWCTYVCAALF